MPKAKMVKIEARKHILKALQFIIHNSDFAQLPKDQNRRLESMFSKLKTAKNKEWSADISPFEIPIQDANLERHHPSLLIGGSIIGKGEEIRWYSLSVCVTFTTDINDQKVVKGMSESGNANIASCCLSKHSKRKRIVRRFHFDYQPDESNKSTFHLQYGGKHQISAFTDDMHYCLEHFLEIPRFPYPPMDLVLLIDLMIREFTTPLRKWREETNWKNLVFESQKILWKTYWNQLSEYFNESSKKTIHELMYDKSVAL